MTQTNRPTGEHNLLATFDGPQAARDAMLTLERHGFDAGDYELIADRGPAPTGRRSAAEDVQVSGEAVKHFGGAGVIGALIGAAILVGAMHAVGFGSLQVAADIGAAIGGAVVGFLLAGLWNVFSSTAVNPDVWDTFLPGVNGSPAIAVHVDDRSKADRAAELLDAHGAVHVDRFDRGGHRIAA